MRVCECVFLCVCVCVRGGEEGGRAARFKMHACMLTIVVIAVFVVDSVESITVTIAVFIAVGLPTQAAGALPHVVVTRLLRDRRSQAEHVESPGEAQCW